MLHFGLAVFYSGTKDASEFISQSAANTKIDYMPKQDYGVSLTTTFIEGTFQKITFASGKSYDISNAIKKPVGKKNGVSIAFGVGF